MKVNYNQPPFPYYGGKAQAASLVWSLLGGDVDVYYEPFMGSLAVLLARPRQYAAKHNAREIVNDRDGLLVNFWRAVRNDPEQTAYYACYPQSHIDLIARRMALKEWIKDDANLERLVVDETYYDARIAGFWVYAQALAIGGVASDISGPWWRSKDRTKLQKIDGDAGVAQTLPHFLVSRGIFAVSRRHTPMEDRTLSQDPLVNPNIVRWFTFLQQRLCHVVILCDDWSNVVRLAVKHTAGNFYHPRVVGLFLDPPYDQEKVFSSGHYAVYETATYKDVLAWCKAHGDNPHLRIVLAAYEDEDHNDLLSHGWRVYRWYRRGPRTRGRSRRPEAVAMRERERLYASPHCLVPEHGQQEQLAY